MKYPPNIWKQLKNKTKDNLIAALNKDGWKRDITIGAKQIYRHPDGRLVSIHYHPNETFRNPGLLKEVLDHIGWTIEEMKKLKLIK